MSLNDSELQKVIAKCEKELDLTNGKLSPEYFRNDLVLSLIDAIFSIGIRYTIVVNAVNKYDNKFSTQKSANGEHLISDFIKNVDSYCTIEDFAKNCLTLHRTSSRNGILKAEACYKIAKIFQQRKIDTLADFKKYTANNQSQQTKDIDKLFMEVPGQKSGISNSYFYMLLGDDDKCKPDRMLTRFVEDSIGRKPSLNEVEDAVKKVAAILQTKFPHLTVRLLDHLIWGYQKNL